MASARLGVSGRETLSKRLVVGTKEGVREERAYLPLASGRCRSQSLVLAGLGAGLGRAGRAAAVAGHGLPVETVSTEVGWSVCTNALHPDLVKMVPVCVER